MPAAPRRFAHCRTSRRGHSDAARPQMHTRTAGTSHADQYTALASKGRPDFLYLQWHTTPARRAPAGPIGAGEVLGPPARRAPAGPIGAGEVLGHHPLVALPHDVLEHRLAGPTIPSQRTAREECSRRSVSASTSLRRQSGCPSRDRMRRGPISACQAGNSGAEAEFGRNRPKSLTAGRELSKSLSQNPVSDAEVPEYGNQNGGFVTPSKSPGAMTGICEFSERRENEDSQPGDTDPEHKVHRREFL